MFNLTLDLTTQQNTMKCIGLRIVVTSHVKLSHIYLAVKTSLKDFKLALSWPRDRLAHFKLNKLFPGKVFSCNSTYPPFFK